MASMRIKAGLAQRYAEARQGIDEFKATALQRYRLKFRFPAEFGVLTSEFCLLTSDFCLLSPVFSLLTSKSLKSHKAGLQSLRDREEYTFARSIHDPTPPQ
jgi:hypothetical protein